MTDTPSLHGLPWMDRIRLAQGSPNAFYMTGEDALQISGWNITTGVRLTVSGRFMGLDGRIQAFVHDVALTTDRVIASVVRSLGEGWLLNLTLNSGGTPSPYGQTFARAQVVRGLSASGIVIGTLCAGYVTSVRPIAFPGGRVRGAVDGPGNIRSITGTNPAAGVEISETVPTGARWRLLVFKAALTTDATVANRGVRLIIDDGAATIFQGEPSELQTATQGLIWQAANGVQRATATLAVPTWAFPVTMMLLAGYRIATSVNNLQAGDDWGAPQLLVEEWLEGDA